MVLRRCLQAERAGTIQSLGGHLGGALPLSFNRVLSGLPSISPCLTSCSLLIFWPYREPDTIAHHHPPAPTSTSAIHVRLHSLRCPLSSTGTALTRSHHPIICASNICPALTLRSSLSFSHPHSFSSNEQEQFQRLLPFSVRLNVNTLLTCVRFSLRFTQLACQRSPSVSPSANGLNV